MSTDSDLKNRIQTLIESSYYSETAKNLIDRVSWKYVGDVVCTFGQVFTGISAILAFAAGFFDIAILSFVAGCFSTVAIIFTQFSNYSMKQSNDLTDEVNRILTALDIPNVVNITPSTITIQDKGKEEIFQHEVNKRLNHTPSGHEIHRLVSPTKPVNDANDADETTPSESDS